MTWIEFTLLLVPQVSALIAERHLQSAPMQLPQTYRRLVGRHVGQSFREVCEEETVDTSPPGEGKVQYVSCLHKQCRPLCDYLCIPLPHKAELIIRAPAHATLWCKAQGHLHSKPRNVLPCLCLFNDPLAYVLAYWGIILLVQPGVDLRAAQVLVKVIWAGINGGCETFRVRGEPYTACGPTRPLPISTRPGMPCM